MKLFSPDNSTCQPLYLFPDQGLAFTRCQILPGVTLQRLKGPLKKLVALANQMPGEKGGYNFAVLVQHGQYAEHVNQQRKTKGHEPLDDFLVETSSITKHVVLSLVLVARIRFRIGGELQMKMDQGKDKKKSRLAGYGPGRLDECLVHWAKVIGRAFHESTWFQSSIRSNCISDRAGGRMNGLRWRLARSGMQYARHFKIKAFLGILAELLSQYPTHTFTLRISVVYTAGSRKGLTSSRRHGDRG
ncbi:MAG: hypothetical protein ACYC0X_31590 [Pirellulaceae bacterium]